MDTWTHRCKFLEARHLQCLRFCLFVCRVEGILQHVSVLIGICVRTFSRNKHAWSELRAIGFLLGERGHARPACRSCTCEWPAQRQANANTSNAAKWWGPVGEARWEKRRSCYCPGFASRKLKHLRTQNGLSTGVLQVQAYMSQFGYTQDSEICIVQTGQQWAQISAQASASNLLTHTRRGMCIVFAAPNRVSLTVP